MSANAIGATPDSTPLADLADADLLDRVRHGDDDAFVVLWRRHLPAAQAVATRFRGRVAPEDLVAEASARILRLLRQGVGPRDNFRAYFTSTVRTVGVDAVRRDMSALPTDTADLDGVAESEAPVGPEDDLGSDLVREAFSRLPERERQLLWMTMVDGAAPRAVAPRLGVSPNLVSVRVMRAKEALRGHYLDVWVQQRSSECASAECRWTLDHLSAHVRGRSTPRRYAKVEAHLASCPRDAALADNLRRISTGFAGLVLPLLLAGASQALGSGAGHGAVGLLTTGGAGLGGASAGTAGATGAATGTVSGAASGAASGASTLVTGVAGAGSTGIGGVATTSTAAVSTVSTATATTVGATTASAAALTGSSVGVAASGVATGAAASGIAASAVVTGAVASGVTAAGATAAGAAALVPVAVAAGGATIGGLTISPPVATAVAGLVIGLGVAPAVVLSHGKAEHAVVQQLPSSSATQTVRPGAVGPSTLPDLGSVVGGAVDGAVVDPVISATVPVTVAATSTATASEPPSPTATPTSDPAADPPAASTPSAPAPPPAPAAPAAEDPAPAPAPSAPAEEPSPPAPAGVAGSDDAVSSPGAGAPSGAPAADGPGGSGGGPPPTPGS